MEITIYSTSSCAACQTLTAWLDQQGLPYTKKITDEDEVVMAEFMSVNDGMIGVPFTVIVNNGQTTKISGFDRARLQAALADA